VDIWHGYIILVWCIRALCTSAAEAGVYQLYRRSEDLLHPAVGHIKT